MLATLLTYLATSSICEYILRSPFAPGDTAEKQPPQPADCQAAIYINPFLSSDIPII